MRSEHCYAHTTCRTKRPKVFYAYLPKTAHPETGVKSSQAESTDLRLEPMSNLFKVTRGVGSRADGCSGFFDHL